MQEQINENLKKPSTWKRIVFIMLFAIIVGLVRVVLWGIILLQIAYTLLTGNSNKNILDLGKKLAAYLYHILLFLTFNTDEMPFPFSDWNTTETLEIPNKYKSDN
ncbi:MAG: DUF4389 domain-containing protein [Methylicorpusculum sp.]|uniref:DUF4389 domain-containing protein n=1 Tax=Methylicorpusculum sp. TaxID=2713644 RepID=UPI00271F1D8A|nr:DUF4389 domain-containing protein [Methylicorpusculum sp.]MDO8844018.1 DUF4389 domain-containing protein [Methylicorpusculum sp.]MDO8939083.1 DUF4389 domain-containing protein [Methylicorpusculum sp.]MDO9238687.1 DUF4389 domain-containing protein [Methylicorpusculum sp.]MDP2177578.1 DUF4389 domain-containing protein [Methylicorpusculum sp.]MDP2200926.1 DUF4389 domain-containing protein [Methylicorpusculum sp.]